MMPIYTRITDRSKPKLRSCEQELAKAKAELEACGEKLAAAEAREQKALSYIKHALSISPIESPQRNAGE